MRTIVNAIYKIGIIKNLYLSNNLFTKNFFYIEDNWVKMGTHRWVMKCFESA